MNMMRIFYIGLSGVGMMFSSMASGHDAGGLQSPACGVVCDPYICVNSDGISPELIDWPPESPDNQYHLNK